MSTISQKVCLVNIGLYRTGTTTLSEAVSLALNTKRVERTYDRLKECDLRSVLLCPEKAVTNWWFDGGNQETRDIILNNHYLSDGWTPFLPFLPVEELIELKRFASDNDIVLHFIVSTRNVRDLVLSDLHHWVLEDLEKKHGLTTFEREELATNLEIRAMNHESSLVELREKGFPLLVLRLEQTDGWSFLLSSLYGAPSEPNWKNALNKAGKKNKNPVLPLQAVLLTFRFEKEAIDNVVKLVTNLEKDVLAQYIIVIGIDEDQFVSQEKEELDRFLSSRSRIRNAFFVKNETRNMGRVGAVPICRIWNNLAYVAWSNGADWVMFLGDDLYMECKYYYRDIYRSFLNNEQKFNVQYFGCPTLNDVSFKGFPSFPVLGKTHFDIFRDLIPPHREFYNQDLDPYLYRVYQKFAASSFLEDVKVVNNFGGTNTRKARYKRVPAPKWKDWVLQDDNIIRNFLEKMEVQVQEVTLIDVLVPTYRLVLENLVQICSLSIPDYYVESLFIIIVDNPHKLKKMFDENSIAKSEQQLEEYLRQRTQNNGVRVRCNTQNMGAPESRNRAIQESSADFVLFLDDDVKPSKDLLLEYKARLDTAKCEYPENEVSGLIGLVRFPRYEDISSRHAEVLMSYLTFVFEIADTKLYENPAWGVTANILLLRTPLLQFDTVFAKTGGGEDVDMCLNATKHGGKFFKAPKACVDHEFWSGNVFALAKHFYGWSRGDSALFHRHQRLCYYSAPNIAEFISLIYLPMCFIYRKGVIKILFGFLTVFVFEVVYEVLDYQELKNRIQQLGPTNQKYMLYCAGMTIANFYVFSLEMGRLIGHISRLEFANVFSRFDWHAGQLEGASTNFRKKEIKKAILFFAILAMLIKF